MELVSLFLMVLLLAVIIYGGLGLLLQAILGFFGVVVPLWVAVGIIVLIGTLMPSVRGK